MTGLDKIEITLPSGVEKELRVAPEALVDAISKEIFCAFQEFICADEYVRIGYGQTDTLTISAMRDGESDADTEKEIADIVDEVITAVDDWRWRYED